MNCLFCADTNSIRRLPDKKFNSIINELKENRRKFDSLIITGGEPTIYKRLFEVVRYAKNVCKYERICLVTNGILLSYSDFLDEIIKSGVSSFQVSYFALNEKKHNAISRTKGLFFYVNRGIKNAVICGKEVRINLVVTKLNYMDLPRLVTHLIKLRVSSITLAFMNPAGESVRDGKSVLVVRFSSLMPFIKKTFVEAEKLNFNSLYLENFPLCVGRDYLNRITDLSKPKDNADYYNSAKSKMQECFKCESLVSCDGVWSAYLEQFDGKELKPFISALPIIARYQFEIAGLEIGLKKTAILNLKLREIPRYLEEFKKNGYYCRISNFCYLIRDEMTALIKGQRDDGEYSLYISKHEEVCSRLKYLDYYHQFKVSDPAGKSSREIFFEISNILGYPKCCSEFLWSCHDADKYKNMQRESDGEYDSETIYKLLALRGRNEANFKLNNFNLSFPSFFNFFVCGYDCKNALIIADKLLDYIKDKHSDWYAPLVKALKMPIIFFSAYRIIYFEGVTKIKKRVYYSACFTRNERLFETLDKNKVVDFKDKVKLFLEGNSFEVKDRVIRIYKNGKFIHLLNKKSKNDGIFIEFK